ncbi:uncharacterized protein B0H18DRAFT_1123517 [Fomitopsis serialis]|uniref:uncharacterized protein n=1 Tax=Fomitopsis serialis TaxID=139415 RepID=UPI0020086288|nr:uncharacterized protein B0H18DRAFT_1123517 [Neoantrodia serialis]KAH9917534.1 hypothetical protein B0H18DRAFT_1123517 [Neoantrodia serialis]
MAMVQELQGQLQSHEMDIRGYYEEQQRLIAREAEAKQELVESRRREARITEECHEWRTLAETRQQELAEAQSFLASPDNIAESDIVQTVRALDAEIYQAVKRTAEGCRLRGGEADAAVLERMNVLMGPTMAGLLHAFPPREDDRIILEMALQTTVTTYVAGVISSWIPSSGSSTNQAISSIYSRILRSESQAVAGRWRTLTRKYATSSSAVAKDQETRHVQRLMEDATTILMVARVVSWDESDLRGTFEIIVKAAMQMRRMIGEDVAGSEYEVFVEEQAKPFQPEVMIDEHAPRRKRQNRVGRPVVCALTLGLRRTERDNRSGSRGRLEVKTLVKPQVILDTIVDDLGLVDDTK